MPVTDLGAGLFAAVGHPGGAALPRPHRPRPAHRHLARRCRPGAVGVGGHGVLQRPRRARPARFRAPDERAVSGGALRRRLHHARRRQPADLREGRRGARPSGVDRRRRDLPPTPTRVRASRGAGGRHRSGHGARRRARPGSTRLDAAGIPCGPILDYAEAFDQPQAAGPRDVGRRSTTRCSAACAPSARRSRCRRRRSIRTGGRRCSASTRRPCSARSATPTTTSPACATTRASRRPAWAADTPRRCRQRPSRRPGGPAAGPGKLV